MSNPTPQVIARLIVDSDDLTPIGYDSHGAPIYAWQTGQGQR